MPSRVVDEAWHRFILDSASYIEFCDHTYGEYLHHFPEESYRTTLTRNEPKPSTPGWSTVSSKQGESVLWDLDQRLGVPEPLGIVPESELRSVPAISVAAAAAHGSVRDRRRASGGDGGGGGGCGGGGG